MYRQHTHDLSRADASVSAGQGQEEAWQLRDWNEEFQSCKEMNRETLAVRFLDCFYEQRLFLSRSLFSLSLSFPFSFRFRLTFP